MVVSEQLIPLIAALPIFGFAFTALLGRRIGRFSFLVPLLLIVATWVIAMGVVYTQLTGGYGEEGVTVFLWQWIPAGTFQVDVAFHVDNLTACLLIVVTTIGMLVHLYSVGYMSHDPARWRFFAYLNLFMFSMLLLVLADNFLVMFAAWELVGLSSYSLIGFWYPKRSAALAAKKAFIVNRVGDVGFALGIMTIWVALGTLNIAEVNDKIGTLAPFTIALIAFLVFCGAAGKSAQFPLHVWLPDAMEGPTPVSALIHAATMVNAGVYLVARTANIYAHAPEVMVIVAAIGTFTAILAASIAFTQTDIKRVLAYSTLSQLGLMFAALGVGAYVAAIFHLMTHGFFKGLLFLGSGSVIHAVHDEQDMNKMGGLWRKTPITHWTMLIGTLALAGIPPLAGFFSKDEILGESFKFGFSWVFAIGLIVAVMTAFYMFRLMGKTFYGSPSAYAQSIWDKIHEGPWTMLVPLILLAIPSLFIGDYLGLPLGASRITAVARARLRTGGGDPRPHGPRVPDLRDRRRPDPREHRRGDPRRDREHVAVRHLQDPDAPGHRRADHRGERRDALPVPRVAEQVVVRRPVRPALHPDRRPRRRRLRLVRRPRDRRHRQRRRARSPRAPAASSGGSRPAGSRTTPSVSPSASSSWPARTST